MPSIPTWGVGQVLTAADVNNWLVPLAAVKTADQSVTSSVILVNDNELVVTLAASCTYDFQCYLDYEGAAGAGNGIQWTWNGPAGYALRYQGIYNNTAATPILTSHTGSFSASAGSGGAGVLQGASMFGTVVTAATAGTLTLQWAQATSSATATIVHAQSYMKLQRIG
jgi:hypothetical protein